MLTKVVPGLNKEADSNTVLSKSGISARRLDWQSSGTSRTQREKKLLLNHPLMPVSVQGMFLHFLLQNNLFLFGSIKKNNFTYILKLSNFFYLQGGNLIYNWRETLINKQNLKWTPANLNLNCSV